MAAAHWQQEQVSRWQQVSPGVPLPPRHVSHVRLRPSFRFRSGFRLAYFRFGQCPTRRNFTPIADRFGQAFFVMDMGKGAIIARQLVIMIHFDGIKRAKFGTQTAIHANVNVDVKLFRLRIRPTIGQCTTLNPDTLWRTHLGTNPARSTQSLPYF